MATSADRTWTSHGSGRTKQICSRPRPACNGSRWWSRGTADRQTVLVTGIDGFAGSHLADLLTAEQHTVHGTIRHSRPEARAELPQSVTCHAIDLLDRDAVDALLHRLRPQWVFHLAAMSSPAASWDDPAGTLANNAGAEANLLAALVRADPMPRVLVVGSSDEYGRPRRRAGRLDEDTPLRPVTPYGVSKVTQDLLALQYHLSHNLPAVRVRPFNHAGPRQEPHFAIASFAQQIARIELGRQPPKLKVGNLDARRDFTDVRDIVRGYLLAIVKGKAGDVYNLGSGKAPSLRRVVTLLLKLTKTKVTVEFDASRTRAAEADVYVCDPRRFQRVTGWRPKITLERMLGDTLDYWRRREASVA